MSIDFSVRATDLAIVFATLAGPFLAVYVTEKQRKKAEARNRKIHVFRSLMATRSANLAAAHVEALNLVEVEFDPSVRSEKDVVDAWRLYLAHLNDSNYPPEVWGARRVDLLVELLFSMSRSLGYSYGKNEIRSGTYFPKGYGDAENENTEIRKLWLDVLRGRRRVPMRVELEGQPVDTSNGHTQPPPSIESDAGRG